MHGWSSLRFQLIDVTTAFQGWRGRERDFLPKAIVKESVSKQGFLHELTAPPELRKGFRVRPEQKEFWTVFTPFEVDADRALNASTSRTASLSRRNRSLEADLVLAGVPPHNS